MTQLLWRNCPGSRSHFLLLSYIYAVCDIDILIRVKVDEDGNGNEDECYGVLMEMTLLVL